MNTVSKHQATPAERAQRAILSGMLVNSANAQRFNTAWRQANPPDDRKRHDESRPRDPVPAERPKSADAPHAKPRHDATESCLRALDEQARQVAACLQALSGIQTHFGAATDVAPALCGTALQAARAQALRALIVRCVRFALLADSEVVNDGKLRIVLAPELFPDTEFLLQRSGQGWQLDAHSSSAECVQLLANGVDVLRERFAAKGLGQIAVSIASQ